jgi:TPR repeat protein
MHLGDNSILLYLQAGGGGLFYKQVRAGCSKPPPKKKPAQALVLARSSEAARSAIGQFVLGGMYNDGDGVAKDAKEAVRLYRLAADGGGPPDAARLLPRPVSRRDPSEYLC